MPPLSVGSVAEPAPESAAPVRAMGRFERLLSRFGIAHISALRRSEQAAADRLAMQSEYTARLRQRVHELEEAVQKLWAVNQTWAWDDNAVIRVRKPVRAS